MVRKIFRLIVVFLGGFTLAKGSIQLTKNRRLNNPHGRVVGLLMLVSGVFGGVLMVAGFVSALVYGLLNLATGDRVQRL